MTSNVLIVVCTNANLALVATLVSDIGMEFM